MLLSFLLRCEIDDALDELHQKLSENCTVILSTNDGYEVARRGPELKNIYELETIRELFFNTHLSADKKTEASQPISITVESEFGNVLITGIENPDYPMTLQVIAPGEQVLAKVLYQTKKCAEVISKL